MDKVISRKWQIVIFVSLFNVFAEYALRGFNNFTKIPILSIALFLNYFPYFTLAEDMITRYKLRGIQLALFGLYFGLIWQLVGPSVVYFPPQILGLNWAAVFFVNFVWWVPLQTVLGFYIAQRIIKRDWQTKLLSEKEKKIYLAWFIVAASSLRLFVYNPPVFPGALVLLAIIFLVKFLVNKMIARLRQNPQKVLGYTSLKVMDILAVVVVLYIAYSAFFLTSQPGVSYVTEINMDAMRSLVKFSSLATIFMAGYRLISRKSIPV